MGLQASVGEHGYLQSVRSGRADGSRGGSSNGLQQEREVTREIVGRRRLRGVVRGVRGEFEAVFTRD